MRKALLIVMLLLANPAIAQDTETTSWWDDFKDGVVEMLEDCGTLTDFWDGLSSSRIGNWR